MSHHQTLIGVRVVVLRGSSTVVDKCAAVIVGFEPSVSTVTYQTSFFMLVQIEYYTNVLTIQHISSSTGVPAPDIGVKRFRI